MLHIANPIYDIVFKYMMEDERVARIILSALLKKEITEVTIRRNEYSNSTRDTLSIFRIDFGATVHEDDGTSHLVLIEIQKTWLETETLRFRQYLGAHYANVENILRDSVGYAIPMVTVYLLGHKVGDIEEPVLYVRRKAYDYDGNEVTQGIPDPFIDSLTHDSIIVQIPRLHGRVNNRLERILSVFDQSRKEESQQILSIEEQEYNDDDDMMHIIHRLLAANADAEMRHAMNVEDEYFSIIENRDTELMVNRQQLAETSAHLMKTRTLLKDAKSRLNESGIHLKDVKTKLKRTESKLNDTESKLNDTESKLNDTESKLRNANTLLEKSKSQISILIKSLHSKGMTIAEIADIIGLDQKTISRLL